MQELLFQDKELLLCIILKQAFFIHSNNVEENENENDRTSDLQKSEDRTSDLQTNSKQNLYLGCPNIVRYVLALKVLIIFCHNFLKMMK
jgi:hypothetical protein